MSDLMNTQNAVVSTTEITNFAEIAELSTNLSKMETTLTLTAEYIELEKPSESFRGVYIGQQVMNITDKATGEEKQLVAARFLNNKKVYINAGAVLLSEISRANVPVGTPLEVTYIRKEGNTKIYEITLLS